MRLLKSILFAAALSGCASSSGAEEQSALWIALTVIDADAVDIPELDVMLIAPEMIVSRSAYRVATPIAVHDEPIAWQQLSLHPALCTLQAGDRIRIEEIAQPSETENGEEAHWGRIRILASTTCR